MNQNTGLHDSSSMNQPTADIDVTDYELSTEVAHGQPQVLSIVTLILGLLSFVALFKPIFWLFPIVAISLGSVSLVTLKRMPKMLGRKAAIIGLVLAIFFGSWAATRFFSRQQWLYARAKRNADIWLQMVQENKLQEAHQLHLRANERAPAGMSLDDFYSKEREASDDYRSVYDSAPMKQYLKVASRAKLRFEGFYDYAPGRMFNDMVLRYVAEYEEDGDPQELVMNLTVRRYCDPRTGECTWQIYLIDPEDDNGP